MTHPSTSGPAWEARPVSGLLLHHMLHTMSELEPERMPSILRTAQLDRFQDAPPPASAGTVATEGDLSRLYAAVHAVMGETLTRSFLISYGRVMSERFKADPGFLSLKAEAERLPAGDARLTWSIQALVGMFSERWSPMELEEDRHEFRLTLAHCPVCARVPSARAPLCASVEQVFTVGLREMTGMRVTAIEFECHGTGAERCRYRVRR
jgi:hypothetical protein